MKKILLIGASGLLGSSVIKVLSPLFNLVTVTKASLNSDYQVDMVCANKSFELFTRLKPDFIINLAAITNLDICEKNIHLAYQVNTKIAENIAQYTEITPNTFVIHISTDHLYDKPLSSEQDIIIRNNYAMTKYCAEKSYQKDKSIILRTNFFGKSVSEKTEGLCNVMYKKASSGEKLTFFDDVYFSPVSINTLCDIIVMCINKKQVGIFNVGSNLGMSKAEFLIQFLQLSGITNFDYKLTSMSEMKFATNRPKDMTMNVSLFEDTYNIKLPNLINEIESVANEFKYHTI